MQGISVILINTKRGKSEEIVINIDEMRRKIILLLSNRTPIIYKIKRIGIHINIKKGNIC